MGVVAQPRLLCQVEGNVAISNLCVDSRQHHARATHPLCKFGLLFNSRVRGSHGELSAHGSAQAGSGRRVSQV